MFFYWTLVFSCMTFMTEGCSLIRNSQYHICSHCKFYLQPQKPEISVAKCAKFGEMDIITGKILYDYAAVCRTSDKKCGLVAKYFIQKNNTQNISLDGIH